MQLFFKVGLYFVVVCMFMTTGMSAVSAELTAQGVSAEQVEKARIKVDKSLKSPNEKNNFLIKFKDEVKDTRIESLIDNFASAYDIFFKQSGPEDSRLYVVGLAENEQIDELMVLFELQDEIEWTEPNYTLNRAAWTVDSTSATPGDYNPIRHWYLDRINLPEVFKDQGCGTGSDSLCGGSDSVVIAVLDSGVAFEDYSASFDLDTYDSDLNTVLPVSYTIPFKASPELPINIWTNPDEDDVVGTDADDNFYCDDRHGADIIQSFDNLFDWYLKDTARPVEPFEPSYNTLCSTSTDLQKEGHPNDDDGHGTYIANLIAGKIDNGFGTSFGIGSKLEIMPVKVLDYEGVGSNATIFEGIYYAVSEGADIINLSIAGDLTPSQLIANGLQYASDNDVLVVISSGNDGGSVQYPGAFSSLFDNVISVGSTNSDVDNSRSYYSAYGSQLTMVAPAGDGGLGNTTWSETFTNAGTFDSDSLATRISNDVFDDFSHRSWIGTSFAAPQVAAVAGLLKAKDSNLTAPQLKEILRFSANDINTISRDNETGIGLLDAKAAWDLVDIYDDTNTIDPTLLGTGRTAESIATIEFDGNLWQAVPGRSFPHPIYTRFSSDGLFDESSSGESWVQWDGLFDPNMIGRTNLTPNLQVFDNGSGERLYLTVKGNDNRIYTKSMGTDFNWDPNWNFGSGFTTRTVATAVFNGQLYQFVRGNSTTDMYQRRTYDGTFDGVDETNGNVSDPGENWQLMPNSRTPITPDAHVFNCKLYLSVIGNDGNIYLARSEDGIFNFYEDAQESWFVQGGRSTVPTSLVTFDDKLYLFVKGSSTNDIYMAFSYNGTAWSNWRPVIGQTRNKVSVAPFLNEVYIFLRGNYDDGIYYTSMAD